MFCFLCKRWERLAQVRRRHGLPAVLRLIFDRLAKRVAGLEMSEMFWLDRAGLKPASATKFDGSFGFLSLDEIEHYQQDPRNSLAPEFEARAREHDDLCFAVVRGDHLANFAWYALHGIEGGDCSPITVTTPGNVAYMYNAYTHPDYRGQHLHGVTTEMAMRELAEFGIDSLIMFVDWTNAASLRSYDRLGARRMGKLFSIGWGPCKLTFVPCVAKKLGIYLGRPARSGRVVDCREKELVAT